MSPRRTDATTTDQGVVGAPPPGPTGPRSHAPVPTTPAPVPLTGEPGTATAGVHPGQDEAARASLSLDETVDELRFHPDELAHLVEERTVALIAAHEEIERAHRRRQDMHERMRIVSSRLGSTDLEGADLLSTLAEIASTVGQVLDVDVVAIYSADEHGRFEDRPVVWHPERMASADDRRLTLTGANRRFLDGVAARKGTLALADVAVLPEPPDGTGGPTFVDTSGYAAWVLAPVHAADDRLLALLGVGLVHPVPEWDEDDIALVDSVGADLGRAIVQAQLYAGQLEVVRQLQELDRAKSEFLSTFSHELRTPLTSIRAYTELLRDEPGIGGDEDRMLEVIEKNSVRLSALIEDILTLSHLNSAVYDIDLVPVDVNPLVEEACESLLPTALGASLTLTPRTADGPAVVLGDEHQLERLVLNLVSNAVKFTPPGGHVHVTVSASASAVVLSVVDDGIGIPADEQNAVFGRFFRGDEATREVIPGTGLGLAIVQAIVEHHGGTLTLTSAPGRGTTVRVHLPSAPVERGRGQLQAQGGAGDADTDVEDLLPVGVRSSGAGQDVPGRT
jgi:two-component system, OmpR family, phosphate regulon sensor histidine kinase PhoR